MNYQELLKKYEQGQLPPEEAARVAQEVDRQEAIGDYLFGKQMEDGKPPEVDGAHPSLDEAEQFTSSVRHAVRKVFVRAGLITGAAAVAITLFLLYALSPLLIAANYNPGEKLGEHTNRLSLDWGVFSEMTLPENIREFAVVRDLGYGTYSFVLPEILPTAQLKQDYAGRFTRGALELYTPAALRGAPASLFADYWTDSSRPISQQDGGEGFHAIGRRPALARLQELPEETYKAYVSFELPVTLAEAEKAMQDANIAGAHTWYKVSVDRGSDALMFGFRLRGNISILEGWDAEEFPLLRLDPLHILRLDAKGQEDAVATHFTSMLRYLSQQEEFVRSLGLEEDNFRRALEEVETKGLRISGAILQDVSKERLLTLSEDPAVYSVYVPNR